MVFLKQLYPEDAFGDNEGFYIDSKAAKTIEKKIFMNSHSFAMSITSSPITYPILKIRKFELRELWNFSRVVVSMMSICYEVWFQRRDMNTRSLLVCTT